MVEAREYEMDYIDALVNGMHQFEKYE